MFTVIEKTNITLNRRKVTRGKVYELAGSTYVFKGFVTAKGWNASNAALLRAFQEWVGLN